MSVSAAPLGAAVLKRLAPALAASPLGPVARAHETVSATATKALPHMGLYCFGSAVAFGVAEPSSDVDFVLLDRKAVADGKGLDCPSQKARMLQTHALSKFAHSLRQAQPMWAIEEVRRARVPVIRVKAPQLAFDVTANRRNGVRNSWLLRRYFEQYPQGRLLAMAVKDWSKRTGINGPHGYLTSYAFNLLVVHYYIAQGKMSFVDLAATDVAAVSPLPEPLPLDPEPSEADLGAEVLDFFRFFEAFDAASDVVTLSRPGATQRAQLGWTVEREDQLRMSSDAEARHVSYRLCIEDPFEVNLNVGRNVSAFKLDMLRRSFAAARTTGLGLITID